LYVPLTVCAAGVSTSEDRAAAFRDGERSEPRLSHRVGFRRRNRLEFSSGPLRVEKTMTELLLVQGVRAQSLRRAAKQRFAVARAASRQGFAVAGRNGPDLKSAAKFYNVAVENFLKNWWER
jgi:hypothetical protein